MTAAKKRQQKQQRGRERSTAFEMTPAELRRAVELESAVMTVLDHDPEADLMDLDADEVATEDMDGDEIDQDESDDGDTPPGETSGILTESGDLLGSPADGPLLDPDSIYLLTVIPGGPAPCSFEPPGWFHRVRDERARAWVHAITETLRALAALLSAEFQPFLVEPSPVILGDCEWRILRNKAFKDTLLLQKGLETRLNERLPRDLRLSGGQLGRLLRHIWLLWPDANNDPPSEPNPIIMPLSLLHEREFQLDAAAALCLGGFEQWTVDTAPVVPRNRKQRRPETKRVLKNLDANERLRTAATCLRIDSQELDGRIKQLAASRAGHHTSEEST